MTGMQPFTMYILFIAVFFDLHAPDLVKSAFGILEDLRNVYKNPNSIINGVSVGWNLPFEISLLVGLEY